MNFLWGKSVGLVIVRRGDTEVQKQNFESCSAIAP